MFFLLPILLFAALAVNSLASPSYGGWPLRARSEVGSSRARRDEFKIHSRTESSHRNFSLPLPHQERSDVESRDRTPSPLSPRNFEFPLKARDDASSEYNSTATTSTGPVRPRNAFALRPRIRPRKSEESLAKSALIQRLTTRQTNDSSDEPLNETLVASGNPIPGLSAPIPNAPGFNATILSPNGTDITSNFKIMVYRSPKIVALDELNGKRHKKRQGAAVGERVQNKCQSGTAVFKYSHCTPKGSVSGTTRTFQVWCLERSNTVGGTTRIKQRPKKPGERGRKYTVYENTQRPRAEPAGTCDEDEVCMDSHMSWVDPNDPHEAMYTVARCVSTRIFKQLPSTDDLRKLVKSGSNIDIAGGWSTNDLFALGEDSDTGSSSYFQSNQGASSSNQGASSSNQGASSSNPDLAGSMMSVRLSTLDSRPLPAEVEVDSGRARTSGRQGSIESHACREPCLEVSTTDFPADTNWVSTHARLVSTLAVAGVMWVAFFH